MTYKYTDLCNAYWTGGPCMFYSPLDYWQHNTTKLSEDIDANKIRKRRKSSGESLMRIPVLQSNIIGSLTYDTNNNILSGKGLLTNFLLSSNETLVDAVKDWEEKFRSLDAWLSRRATAISYRRLKAFP